MNDVTVVTSVTYPSPESLALVADVQYHEPYLSAALNRKFRGIVDPGGTVAKLAMRQPFVLFKGLTFQKLCLPGAFRPGDHHNKMLRPGLCVVHASPQYL